MIDAEVVDVRLIGSEEATEAGEVRGGIFEGKVDCSFCLNMLACIFHNPLSSDLSSFESVEDDVCLEVLVKASFLSRSLILLVIDMEAGLE